MQFHAFNREIGPGNPVFVIAEVANTHEGCLATAHQMVDRLTGAGVDAIKFQLHLPEAEMLRSHPKFETQAMRSLSLDALLELKRHTEHNGMHFLCSAFSREASDALEHVGVGALKIGSGEITDPAFLAHVARKRIPTILSTGMSSRDETRQAIRIFGDQQTPIMLLHCVSVYPSDYRHLMLDTIKSYQTEFGIAVGFSCHLPDIHAPLLAAAMGACLLECHYTMDKNQKGTSDHRVSLLPEEFKQLVGLLRSFEAAKGVREGVLQEELPTIAWARHGIVSVRPLKKGQRLDSNSVSTKRPLFDGIPAAHLSEVLGRVAARDIDADQLIRWEDVCDTTI